jgi:hypothetical protein
MVGFALLLSGFAAAGNAQRMDWGGDGLPYNDVERAGGIEYVSGGIGIEAEGRLRQFAKDHGYNVKLLFTLNAGNYLADVDVTVKNQRGETLVRDVSDGPYLFAKMPSGSYTVTATHGGKTETRRINVGSGGMRTAHFRWPANPETDFTFASSGYPVRGSGGS